MVSYAFHRVPTARKFTPVCLFHRKILLWAGMREWVRDRDAVLVFLTVTSRQQVCDNCEVGWLELRRGAQFKKLRRLRPSVANISCESFWPVPIPSFTSG